MCFVLFVNKYLSSHTDNLVEIMTLVDWRWGGDMWAFYNFFSKEPLLAWVTKPESLEAMCSMLMRASLRQIKPEDSVGLP